VADRPSSSAARPYRLASRWDRPASASEKLNTRCRCTSGSGMTGVTAANAARARRRSTGRRRGTARCHREREQRRVGRRQRVHRRLADERQQVERRHRRRRHQPEVDGVPPAVRAWTARGPRSSSYRSAAHAGGQQFGQQAACPPRRTSGVACRARAAVVLRYSHPSPANRTAGP